MDFTQMQQQELFNEKFKKVKKGDISIGAIHCSANIDDENSFISITTSTINIVNGYFEDYQFSKSNPSIIDFDLILLLDHATHDYYLRLWLSFVDKDPECVFFSNEVPGELKNLIYTHINKKTDTIICINPMLFDAYYLNQYQNTESIINFNFRKEVRIIFTQNSQIEVKPFSEIKAF